MVDRDELLKKLKHFEADLRDQPLYLRKKEVPKANELRRQLGMLELTVDLQEMELQICAETSPHQIVQAAAPEYKHDYAKKLHAIYTARQEKLEPHRLYASKIVEEVTYREKKGEGRTPIKPLALGNNGGPILCDICKKPFPLEGGKYQGIAADKAWEDRPKEKEDFMSYIWGGLVFELQVNGTVRFYHQYNPGERRGKKDENQPSWPAACYPAAQREDCDARKAWTRNEDPGAQSALLDYATEELKMEKKEARRFVQDVCNTLYGFDVGVGINGPKVYE